MRACMWFRPEAAGAPCPDRAASEGTLVVSHRAIVTRTRQSGQESRAQDSQSISVYLQCESVTSHMAKLVNGKPEEPRKRSDRKTDPLYSARLMARFLRPSLY